MATTTTFTLHQVLPNGRSQYRRPGSTAAMRFGPKMFDGPPPSTISVDIPNLAPIAADQHESKKQAREAEKQAKLKARDEAKAKRDAEKQAAKEAKDKVKTEAPVAKPGAAPVAPKK